MAPGYPEGLRVNVLLAQAKLARRLAIAIVGDPASSELYRLADELDAEFERREVNPAPFTTQSG
jgi:hypothetical protein